MSRPDKRFFDPTKEEAAIRVFAFSNALGGYKPMHGAPQPLIILRTKVKSATEHPATMWEPLAQKVIERNPQTYAVYVLDCSPLGETAEMDERTTRNTEGPLLRRLSNLLSKLAPDGAILVAAGATCELAVKLLMYSSPARKHLSGLVLAMCASKPLEDIATAAARHMIPSTPEQQQGENKFTIDIFSSALGTTESAESFKSALSPISEIATVSTHAATMPTLFGKIASVLVPTVIGVDDSIIPRGDLECYQIFFVLSRHTKQSEQEVHPSPVSEPPGSQIPDKESHNAPPRSTSTAGASSTSSAPLSATASANATSAALVALTSSGNSNSKKSVSFGGQVQAAAASSSSSPPAASTSNTKSAEILLLPDLIHLKSPAVRVQGRVKDSSTIATVHGLIKFDTRVQALSDCLKGATVTVDTSIRRNDDGQTFLSAASITFIECNGEAGFYAPSAGAALEDVPRLHFSRLCHFYGAALIRGRKIALARSLEGVWKGMRIPHRPHCTANETPFECASTAVCNQCGDVTPDAFFIHHAIAPVVYYPSPNCVVTLFVAIAVQEGTAGVASDAHELQEDLADSYDWYTLEWAVQKMRTQQEKIALEEVARNVGRAADAGVYVPMSGFGIFGRAPVVVVAEAPEAETTITTQTSEAAAATQASSLAATTANVTGKKNSNAPRYILVLHEPVLLQEVATPHLDVVFASLGIHHPDDLVRYSPASFGEIVKQKILSADASSPLPFVPVLLPGDVALVAASAEIPTLLAAAGIDAGSIPVKVAVIVSPEAQDALEERGELLAHNSRAAQRLVEALPYADIVAFFDESAIANGSKRPSTSQIATLAKLFNEEVCVTTLSHIRGSLLTERVPVVEVVAAADQDAPSVFVVTLDERLPLHPGRLHELFYRSPCPLLGGDDGSWGLLHTAGHGWLATQPLHRVTVRVDHEHKGLHISKGDPWWCCVEDEFVPDDEDKSAWHPEFGSRSQSLMFVVNARPGVVHEAVAAEILGLLGGALCPPDSSRGWSRLEDPFRL